MVEPADQLRQLLFHKELVHIAAGLELAWAAPALLDPLLEGADLEEDADGWQRLAAGPGLRPRDSEAADAPARAGRVLLALVCRAAHPRAEALRKRIRRLVVGRPGEVVAGPAWSWAEFARLPRLEALRLLGWAPQDPPIGPAPEGVALGLRRLDIDCEPPRGRHRPPCWALPPLPRLEALRVGLARGLAGLAGCPGLETLRLNRWYHDAWPADLPPGLRTVLLEVALVRSLAPLAQLPRLERLGWERRFKGLVKPGWAWFPELRSLEGMPQVELVGGRLRLDAPQLTDLRGLARLRGLRRLTLNDCVRLESLEGLEACTELEWLSLPRLLGPDRDPFDLPLGALQRLVAAGRLRWILVRGARLVWEELPDWLRPLVRWDLEAPPELDEEPPPPHRPAPPAGLGPEARSLWERLAVRLGNDDNLLVEQAVEMLPAVARHPDLADALCAGLVQQPTPEPPWWLRTFEKTARWAGGVFPGLEPSRQERWWPAFFRHCRGGPGTRAQRARLRFFERDHHTPLDPGQVDEVTALETLRLWRFESADAALLAARSWERLLLVLDAREELPRFCHSPPAAVRALRLRLWGEPGFRWPPLPQLPGLKKLLLDVSGHEARLEAWTVQPELEELVLRNIRPAPALRSQPLRRLRLDRLLLRTDLAADCLPSGLESLALSSAHGGLPAGWVGVPELILGGIGPQTHHDLSGLVRVRRLRLRTGRVTTVPGLERLPAHLERLDLHARELDLRALGTSGESAPQVLGVHEAVDLRGLVGHPLCAGLTDVELVLGGQRWDAAQRAWVPLPDTWWALSGLLDMPRLRSVRLRWRRALLPSIDRDALARLPAGVEVVIEEERA